MGSPSANTRTLPTNVQVSQICGIPRFPVSAAAASRCVPSRRGRFHDRIPKGAGRHAESTLSAPLVTAAQAILHFAAPPSAKSRCPPGIRRALSAPAAAVFQASLNPRPPETTAHPSAPFSSGKSRSAEPSPHPQSSAPPHSPVPARSPPQHFSGPLPTAAASPEPPAADSQSRPVLFSAPSASRRSALFSALSLPLCPLPALSVVEGCSSSVSSELKMLSVLSTDLNFR